MAEPVVIGVGACKWIKEPNTKMMTIHYPSTSPTSTLSAHNDSGVDYQVPVGKKFVILRINDTVGTSRNNAICYIWKNTTTDSTVGGTQISIGTGSVPNYNASIAGTASVFYPKDVYIEIPAGNYIVVETSTTQGNVASATIVGIETDV